LEYDIPPSSGEVLASEIIVERELIASTAESENTFVGIEEAFVVEAGAAAAALGMGVTKPVQPVMVEAVSKSRAAAEK